MSERERTLQEPLLSSPLSTSSMVTSYPERRRARHDKFLSDVEGSDREHVSDILPPTASLPAHKNPMKYHRRISGYSDQDVQPGFVSDASVGFQADYESAAEQLGIAEHTDDGYTEYERKESPAPPPREQSREHRELRERERMRLLSADSAVEVIPDQNPMMLSPRLSSYCCCRAFKLKAMMRSFKNRYKARYSHGHLTVTHIDSTPDARVFFFPYGVMVSWGLSEQRERSLLEESTAFQEEPHRHEIEEDIFCFGTRWHVQRDRFVLDRECKPKPEQEMLAISLALAQSISLTYFENTIEMTITKCKPLASDLANTGSISFSRKEISQMMGELFIVRNSINLHLDMLDTPEFVWEHDEFEPHYKNVRQHLDISSRVEVLNKRLIIVHELFGMLNEELGHQHSVFLEWIIIILIVIEILMALIKDLIQYGKF